MKQETVLFFIIKYRLSYLVSLRLFSKFPYQYLTSNRLKFFKKKKKCS